MPSSPALSTASSGHDYLGDEWPQMLDGSQWDGLNLLDLLSRGQSPFGPILDANLLLQEVKDKLSAEVIDIPRVHTGANNYGFHLKLSDQRHVLARLWRADVNMPHYDGFSLRWLHQQIDFEVTTNRLLQNTPGVPTGRLLYHRHPLQHAGIEHGMPKDISGRRFMIFEMAQGQCRLWSGFDQQQRMSTLANVAAIRTALLNLELPSQFVSDWLLWRTFQPVEWMPKELLLPISATRDFWLATLKAKIGAMVKNEGDLIGWPGNGVTVGPKALAAKKSLLRLMPLILPEGDEAVMYRPVLQHDDFGFHNILNSISETGQTSSTSIFDWETGCIVPFALSEITFLVAGWNLTIDEDGELSVYVRPGHPILKRETRTKNALLTPYIEEVIHKVKEARGQDSEESFGELGDWAEQRLAERGLSDTSDL
ncbi:hypothetical protein B0J15DRAFT_564806 [Fusarium solani]|uniref:Uncharacterized protein n=1 Tax=Fusarium solani TaxID=169388 RepID=A0A9P9K5P7_FUSSL|nr:uncharacterized protein B0J15DRAFT_564806 [Fusarium solani]KAH7244950.1 hypothetical protein B0J15DRAFT_564806 [Fusarium solani]